MEQAVVKALSLLCDCVRGAVGYNRWLVTSAGPLRVNPMRLTRP